jgi:pyruvate,water dikinase
MNLIRNFKELRKEDISFAGGKGANLGELIHAKVSVPSGFVVTTDAYDDFVNQNNLKKVIAENLQNKNNNKVIQNTFAKSTIPEDVKTAVLEEYKKLGGGPVAVRSSATAEDLPNASFAGQQETYLNIIGEKELLDALRLTWASLWTERAISYRNHQNIDQKKVKMAVIVQQMVDAEFAGVMFTANPNTGKRKEIIIEASPGLGEAIVLGMVTPDHFVMRRVWLKWRVLESTKGKREVIVKPKKGGGVVYIKKSDVIVDDISELPKEALTKLAKLGVKIEKHFDSPQDIEWVWAEGKISIVQSRPITALPDELPKQNRIKRLLAGTIAEVMPSRPYPLDATTLGFEILINDFLRPFLKLIGLTMSPVNQVFIEEDGVSVRYSGKLGFHYTVAIIFAPFRLISYAIRYNPEQWKNDLLIKGLAEKIKTKEKQNYKDASFKELVATIREVFMIYPAIFEVRIRYLLRVGFAIAGLRFMLWISGRKDVFTTLLYSGIKTKVMETNRVLENLSDKVKANKNLIEIFKTYDPKSLLPQLEMSDDGKTFLKEFYSFLDEYGYRESKGTLIISEPTWKESPETVLAILKSSISTPARSKSKEDWEDVRNTLIAQSILRFWPLKAFFINVLNTARHFQEIREDTRFFMMMPIPTLRRAFLELGDRLTKVQILKEPQEVFYLKLNELYEIAETIPPQESGVLELKGLVSRRKAKYAELENTPFVDPRLYRSQKGRDGALLVGTAGSPGSVKGTARIILNSSEFDRLEPDDILVAPYTNPSWTPLFEIASGVVVDTGSMMSHAAIVAREYGIPAVMGTVDGTTKIKNGDKIHVDGATGKVFMLSQNDTKL